MENDLKNLPTFLTVDETATILRLKRSTTYSYIQQGIIPSIRLKTFIRIPKTYILKMAGMQESGQNTKKNVTVPVRPKGGI